MASRPLNHIYLVGFLLLAATGLWKMRLEPIIEGVPIDFREIVKTRRFADGTPLKSTYTGVRAADALLLNLVAAFQFGVARWHAGLTLQQIHFLVNFYGVLCVWTVEACRKRNQGRVFTYTAVLAFFYQTIGGAFILPLLYYFYVQSSANDIYFSSGRHVPLSYAKAILPAVTLGYGVPTVLMYLPWTDFVTMENMTALWLPSPMYVNFFLLLFSSLPLPSVGKQKKNADLKWVKQIYLAAGVVSAFSHILVVGTCLVRGHPDTSLSFVFLPNRATWKDSTAIGVHWVLQWDWIFCFGTSLVWAWIAVYDILRLKDGRADPTKLVGATLGILAITLLAGPGTALAVVWNWREDRMVELENELTGVKKSG